MVVDTVGFGILVVLIWGQYFVTSEQQSLNFGQVSSQKQSRPKWTFEGTQSKYILDDR